jgi:RNA polymerase sigma factor (TIGR02999 family)
MGVRQAVTKELIGLSEGDRSAADRLFPLVYDELRAVAGLCFGNEAAGHTLQPTALVHETYIRLVDSSRVNWESRSHFFGIAARAMRRILVDHARGRRAAKRGGAALKLSLSAELVGGDERDEYLVSIDSALDHLSGMDPELARVVELRFFGGLTIEETAEMLHVSPKTVKRQWALARAWLHQNIAREQ